MTSIAIMIGGAVLNAAAFTGGSYLAKYIAGNSGQAALAEKTKCWKLIRLQWKNTCMSTRSFLTGSKQTKKSKLRRIKTSETLITLSSSTTRPTPTTN